MAIVATLTALLKLDTSGFNSGLKGAIKNVQKFNRRLSFAASDLQRAGANITALSAPLALFGVSAVRAAAKAEENANKIKVVFSNLQAEASRTITQFASDFKLAESESTKLISTVGDLLTGFDFTQKEALQLSNQVNRLAADLTSFNPGIDSVADASERLTKGLLGQTKAMLGLRIAIRQDAKEFKDLVKEIQEARGFTLQQAKALAILRISTQQSKNAVGDFARTQDSFINLLRRTTQRIIDLKIEVGKFLIEGLQMQRVVIKIINGLKTFTAFVKRLSPEMKRFISLAAASVVILGPLLLIVGSLGLAITGVVSAITALATAFVAMISPVGLVVAGIIGVGVALIKVFDVDLKKVALNVLGFLVNFKTNWSILTTFITTLWTNVWNNLGRIMKTIGGNLVLNVKVLSEKIGAVFGAVSGFIIKNWDVMLINMGLFLADFAIKTINTLVDVGIAIGNIILDAFDAISRGEIPGKDIAKKFLDGFETGVLQSGGSITKSISDALGKTSGFVSLTAGLEDLIPLFPGFITGLGSAALDLKEAAKANAGAGKDAEGAALAVIAARSITGATKGSVEAFRIRAATEKLQKETATNTKTTAENTQEMLDIGVPIKGLAVFDLTTA